MRGWLWILVCVALMGCDEPQYADGRSQVIADPPTGTDTEEDPPETGTALPPEEPWLEGCTEDVLGELYTEYVEPFVSGQVPSSCSQCHMTGIDISIYAQDTACDTMACMVDMGAADLEQPADSEILAQIGMGDPASSVFDVGTEHQAILEWIEWSSRCHKQVCGDIDSGCSQGTGALTTGQMPSGQCNEQELVGAFWDAFVVHQNRCISCHGNIGVDQGSFFPCDTNDACAEGERCEAGRCRTDRHAPTPFIEGLGDASDWNNPEHRRLASNAMYTLLTMDLIDKEEPLDSRLLTKPLPEGFQPLAIYGAMETIEDVPPGVGVGLVHGGDTKFVLGENIIDCRKDTPCLTDDECGAADACLEGYCRLERSVCDETYVQMLTFIQVFLACQE